MFPENPDDEPDTHVVIPQPDYPNETPSEALEAIIYDTLKLAKEMGEMSDDQINDVLQKVLSDRLDTQRKSTFKVHEKS